MLLHLVALAANLLASQPTLGAHRLQSSVLRLPVASSQSWKNIFIGGRVLEEMELTNYRISNDCSPDSSIKIPNHLTFFGLVMNNLETFQGWIFQGYMLLVLKHFHLPDWKTSWHLIIKKIINRVLKWLPSFTARLWVRDIRGQEVWEQGARSCQFSLSA